MLRNLHQMQQKEHQVGNCPPLLLPVLEPSPLPSLFVYHPLLFHLYLDANHA